MKRIGLQGLAPKERKSAFQEVKLLRDLQHPHICSYRDSFVHRPTNQLCLVMTYCEGGDLHKRVQKIKKEHARFSEARVLRWACQLALALQYIHERHNIIHRDIKTQNIFVREDDSLMLGDFGVSRVLDSPTDLANTCVGTPFYMCPELMRKQRYSNKADMWALGCVLYELTTLRHAFDANDMQGLAMKIVRGRYPPLPGCYSANLHSLVEELLHTKAPRRVSTRHWAQLAGRGARLECGGRDGSRAAGGSRVAVGWQERGRRGGSRRRPPTECSHGLRLLPKPHTISTSPQS